MHYTHVVKRSSGYVAGWGRNQDEARILASTCNQSIPADPAHIEVLDWDSFYSLDPGRAAH
jgi:hypothetical protein